jgi:hypothetical protein
MPADTFYLAAEYQRQFPEEFNSFGPATSELATLSKLHADEVSWERLSRDFGVPHRVLAQSYARELLNLPPFPVFMGHSSRLLAETWDSNNLYWARLADEKKYSPAMLNRLVPELTHRMVEKIFATDFEDWPALLRAVRETGEEFRAGKIGPPASYTLDRPSFWFCLNSSSSGRFSRRSKHGALWNTNLWINELYQSRSFWSASSLFLDF